MEIEKLTVGQMAENCYLVYGKKTREAVIIDPGDDGDYLMKKIADLRLKPVLIVATHGHFDHVLGVLELKLAYKISFVLHEKDLFLVKQAQASAKHFLGIKVDPVPLPDRFLKNGEEIKFGSEKLKVMETPGHTPGSICLITDSGHLPADATHQALQAGARMTSQIIFTGDTIFAEGVGRTDFSYSSKEDLANSLKKILKLSDKALVYPGHGEETTISSLRGAKRRSNLE